MRQELVKELEPADFGFEPLKFLCMAPLYDICLKLFILSLLGVISLGFPQGVPLYRTGSQPFTWWTPPEPISQIRPPGTVYTTDLSDIDIWYPVHRLTQPMLFEVCSGLHETGCRLQDETEYSGFSDELVMYLAAGFGLEAMEGKRLLKKRTRSDLRCTLATGFFPLVVYMAGYNGMGRNCRLLERLAENGFIIVHLVHRCLPWRYDQQPRKYFRGRSMMPNLPFPLWRTTHLFPAEIT